MHYLNEADRTLQRAENELREILSSAGKAGAYDEVALLGDTARTLGMLRQRLRGTIPHHDAARTVDGSQLPSMPPGGGTPLLSDPISPRAFQSRESGKAEFGRDERYLIKLAWSKSKGSDYEHRAPFEVARLLVKAILRHGGAKRLVASEKFLPLSSTDKAEVPSYQSYLCLAWLVHEGLIGKNGRRGYTVFDPGDIEKSLEERWENLRRISH